MRQILIFGALLMAGCASAPPPVFDHTTTLNTCANMAPELDALYWKPCMKQAFANIPEGKPVKRMDPPVVKDPPAPYGIDQHDWNMAGLAVKRSMNNAAFCLGAWAATPTAAAGCIDRLNR